MNNFGTSMNDAFENVESTPTSDAPKPSNILHTSSSSSSDTSSSSSSETSSSSSSDTSSSSSSDTSLSSQSSHIISTTTTNSSPSSQSSSAQSSSSQERAGSSSNDEHDSSSSTSYDSTTGFEKRNSQKPKKVHKRKPYHPLILQNAITYDDDDSFFEVNDDSSDFEGTKLPSNCTNKNTNAEIEHFIAEAHDKSINSTTQDSNPPPPSLLTYLSQIASYQISKNATDEEDTTIHHNNQHEQFDTSALIATGILSEEVITEMLLPLAHAHVAKCRDFAATDNMEQDEKYLQMCTLGPIEAISELILDDNTTTTTKEMNLLPSTKVQKWLKEHNITNEFYQGQKNVLDLILSSRIG